MSAMFPVLNVVVLAATLLVVKPAVKPKLVARWMVKPVSLPALSVHVRVTGGRWLDVE